MATPSPPFNVAEGFDRAKVLAWIQRIPAEVGSSDGHRDGPSIHDAYTMIDYVRAFALGKPCTYFVLGFESSRGRTREPSALLSLVLLLPTNGSAIRPDERIVKAHWPPRQDNKGRSSSVVAFTRILYASGDGSSSSSIGCLGRACTMHPFDPCCDAFNKALAGFGANAS